MRQQTNLSIGLCVALVAVGCTDMGLEPADTSPGSEATSALTSALLPSSDQHVSGVTSGSGGTTNLFTQVNDGSDATYVRTAAGTPSGVHSVGYTYTGNPSGPVTKVVVQYRADKATGAGTIQCILNDGTTPIGGPGAVHTLTGTTTTYTDTFTGLNVTDPSTIRTRMILTNTSGTTTYIRYTDISITITVPTAAPQTGAGHWVLLNHSSSASSTAIKAEVDQIFSDIHFVNNGYWQGVQLRINWVDVQPSAGANLTTTILDDFLQAVADDNAHYHTSKRVNLQIQYKSFGATNTAVPSGVDAFQMNNPGWIAELWKSTDLAYFDGFLDKLATWYNGSTNATTLVQGLMFPETACGGCGAAGSGYTGLGFEQAIEGYLTEARAKFPSTLVVDQLTNFFVTTDSHSQQYYLYDLAKWACGHYVGVGGPDAPEYNVNQSTCTNAVPWSDPGTDVITGKGQGSQYALGQYLHVQFSEQNADFRIPNTASGDYSMIVNTLGSTQAVWLNQQGISGTCSNGGNSFDINSVYNLSAIGPITSSPSWNCSAIPATNPW